MRRFRSKLFTDDVDKNKDDAKLVDCLEKDSEHVGPEDKGTHVSKIQAALEAIERTNLTSEKGVYGPNTTTAVKKYKDSPKRKLLQPGQKTADQFVGKRTIRFLDDEMFNIENPRTLKRLSGAPLARLDVPLALQKVDAALRKLRDYKSVLTNRIGPKIRIDPFDKVTQDALTTHFRLVAFDGPRPPNAGTGRGFPRRPIALEDLTHIISHFENMRAVFIANIGSFTDGSPVTKEGKPVAAAAFLDSKKIIFGSHFRNFTDKEAALIGRNSRVAVLIHEGFHAVDVQKKSGDDISVHISEFSPAYDTQAADNSLFNPSSYAGFAAHIFKGSDPKPRFGLGPGSRQL